MSEQLRTRLFDALDAFRLIDSHSHINPHSPASSSLADILGYHYYTELAHSAGMPRDQIEAQGISPRERVRRLAPWLSALDNTVQLDWLLEMARELWGFPHEQITPANWEQLFDGAEKAMRQPGWERQVLDRSKLDAVFLTNDFDDPLTGFDTRLYVPCLRTDDLVFHLAQAEIRDRFERAAGLELLGASELKTAIARLFEHFVAHGARACAISLPPEFNPVPVDPARAADCLHAVWRKGAKADLAARHDLSHFVFWTLAECCAEFHLPFDLMIGVVRGVYPGGVFQGRDLFDSRGSLIQYRELFNAFPQVTFPVSVLASATNQELVAYSWIFPNVVTHGHWWYSNTPAYIEHDAAARLEAVPRTKQIAYYSDMYKLEFALPKFAMAKRILAKILAERFVVERCWTEERAIELGRQVLRGNVERIFILQN